VQDRTKVAIDH